MITGIIVITFRNPKSPILVSIQPLRNAIFILFCADWSTWGVQLDIIKKKLNSNLTCGKKFQVYIKLVRVVVYG